MAVVKQESPNAKRRCTVKTASNIVVEKKLTAAIPVVQESVVKASAGSNVDLTKSVSTVLLG